MHVSGELDRQVAEQVLLASLMESLLHDDGPWEMQAEGHRVPIERKLGDRSITVIGHFPEPLNGGQVDLVCNGEVVQVLTVEPGVNEVTWELSLRLVVAA